MGNEEYKPVWKNRRRVIFGTLLLDAAVLIAVMSGWFKGLDINAAFSAVIVALIARDTAIIGAYVFSATWEDIKVGGLFK